MTNRDRSKLPTVSIGNPMHDRLFVEAYQRAREHGGDTVDIMTFMAEEALDAYLTKLEADRAIKRGNGVHP